MRALTLPLLGLRDNVLIPQRSLHSPCSVAEPSCFLPNIQEVTPGPLYRVTPFSVPDTFCSVTEEDGATLWVGKGALSPLSLGSQQTEKPGVPQKGHRQALEAGDPALGTFLQWSYSGTMS